MLLLFLFHNADLLAFSTDLLYHLLVVETSVSSKMRHKEGNVSS